MNKIAFIILQFCVTFIFSQNAVKHSSYTMENPKKSYNIMLGYDNTPALESILINAQSEDPIFTKSTLIFKKDQLTEFINYLKFILDKKNEWDVINLKNKTTEVTKKIDYPNGDVYAGCVYSGGPVITKTYLYSIYSYIKNGSGIQVSTAGGSEAEPTYIFFPNTKSLQSFISKLDEEKINQTIQNDFKKLNILK
ncbi:hypothetical protein BN1195_02879 [Chryseobacterium oranimense G311]|uniref:hypothetical protein n=1 Tax=Chryseobacterium oranimense TaxID=421058 RepID=UPI000533B52B|nr:hypothetical protein [Chryseobacterium oranimense]CEJ70552.1 hypothetical protein BN1195_02879 [Chryseobacterium oranimense G311]DAG72885.1 MAG TPA: hypothetical protein [Caudoviricetes sp.]